MTNKKLSRLIDRANKPNNKFPKVAISDTIDLTCIGINGEYAIFYLLKSKGQYVGIAYYTKCKKDVHVYIKPAYRRHGIAYEALKDFILPHILRGGCWFYITAISKAGKSLMEKLPTTFTEYKDYWVDHENFQEFPESEWYCIADEMTEKLGLESMYYWWY
ncbi:MAG: hypothetical protein P4L35_06225 [Ignavibacteriaceae bacterium]|nr:hypothetical protein [Ignavibacteriaceae bacterium]